MERMGSKIIEHTKLKKFKDHVILNEFTFDFQRERIELLVKREQNLLLKFTGTLPLIAEK
jgi:ATP-binding cassette subfamily F protein uup